MPDIEIKRGYEILPDNNVRFGIRITNVSDVAISEVEVILDYTESLFNLEGERMQKLGTIPHANTRTAEFILKPLGCVHQVNIEALISFRDPKWEKHIETMRPKEVHCVCPFLRGKNISKSEFLNLLYTGHSAETGLNFRGVSVERLTSFLIQTCGNRHYKVDDLSIDGGRMLYLASESIGEKAYYLLTALIKEDSGLTQVLLKVVSDKPYGLNGFLNETVADLRHVIGTVQSAQEIGVIKKEQVINIIDSVVQRTSFGVGEGVASVNIEGSVVTHTDFKKDENEKEQEKLKKQKEEEKRVSKEKEEKRREEERHPKERVKAKENERKADEVQEKLQRLREEAERKDREHKQKERQEQKRFEKQREDQIYRPDTTKTTSTSTIQKKYPDRRSKQKSQGIAREEKKGTSKNKILAGAVILGGLLLILVMLGPLAVILMATDAPDISKSTPAPTPEIALTPTPVADQKTRTNSIGMEFVLIPAGEFDMGSPSNEMDRGSTEGPIHGVTISNEFYMSRYEVTQKQWREVMGDNALFFKGDTLPVEGVPWDEVQEFIRKLNEKEGTDKYRLPSEAEWEYACRAGTTTRYCFGDSELKLGEYAWYYGSSGTHPVGKKKPNSWGLYDMHGNVWEWVQDVWHGDYNGAPSDGSVWEDDSSLFRVSRGGSWLNNALDCRSAIRVRYTSGSRIYSLGFRLLQEP